MENLSTGADWVGSHTVGATLALGGGVSQGMALIRPDLAMLDRTVATNMAMLDQLMKLGATMPAFGPNMAPISVPTIGQLAEVADAEFPESGLRPSVVQVPAPNPMPETSAPAGPQPRRQRQPVTMTTLRELAASTIFSADEVPTSDATGIDEARAPITAGFSSAYALDWDRADKMFDAPVATPVRDRPPKAARPGATSTQHRILRSEMLRPHSRLTSPGSTDDQARRTFDPLPPASYSPRFQRSEVTIGLTTQPSQTQSLDVTSWAAQVGSASVLPFQFHSQPALDAADVEQPSAPVMDHLAFLTEPKSEAAPPLLVGDAFAPTRTFMQPIPRTAAPWAASSDDVVSDFGSSSEPSTRPNIPRSQTTTTSETRQGTIYLDGARLGRWVLDHLAKTASRPTTGVTGIDPRISAIYPGAATGA